MIKEQFFIDFENALGETEKNLTKKYRLVVNGRKGSRAVVILVPDIIQNYISVLLNTGRNMFLPKMSIIKWGKGDVAIRTLAKNIPLEYPKAFSSNKLRNATTQLGC